MSLTHCATCGHKFKADETLWADGGLIEINHGGGRCRSCFLAADNRWECTDCLTILGDNMKFCWQCGKRRPAMSLSDDAQGLRGKRFQLVWHLHLPRIKFRRFDPEKTDWAYIYDWVLNLGFVEIRRWSTRRP